MQLLLFRQGFNTQPPEGGCFALDSVQIQVISFNTQPPEGGCSRCNGGINKRLFQHTAA